MESNMKNFFNTFSLILISLMTVQSAFGAQSAAAVDLVDEDAQSERQCAILFLAQRAASYSLDAVSRPTRACCYVLPDYNGHEDLFERDGIRYKIKTTKTWMFERIPSFSRAYEATLFRVNVDGTEQYIGGALYGRANVGMRLMGKL